MINEDEQNRKLAQALSITFVTVIMLLLFFKILFY
jgi:hypothetical protein